MDIFVSRSAPVNTAFAPGSRENPVADLSGALGLVKKAVKAGLTEPLTVHLSEGEYLTEGLVMGEDASGTPEFPVCWKAEGKVTVNGGLTLSPSLFTGLSGEEKERLRGDAKEKVVKCDLTKLGLTRDDWGEMCAIGNYHSGNNYDGAVVSPMWCELFVNGTRQEIARYPDRDFLFCGEPVKEGIDKHRGLLEEEFAKVRNPEGDIYSIDPETAKRAASWKSLDGVWMFGYPMFGWADMSSPVVSIDPDKCTMETAWVSSMGIREHGSYYLYNIFEELDCPGEWFLDREKGILYLYPAAELETADIKLSLITTGLVRVEDGHDIVFSGIDFTGTRGDGLEIKGKRIKIENCVIRNVAGWAVVLEGEDCLVTGSEIERTGRGGIRLTGGDRADLTPSGDVVSYNHIHHIAEIFRTYNAAVELFGVGHLVTHNEIHDSAHVAILFHGNNHVMEYNEIYEVCKLADDASAIYAGRDYTIAGNIIRYNCFHDMRSDADNSIGIFGTYCDDNMGATYIEHNVFIRCQSAVLFHGGHDLNFRGNLIALHCPKSVYSIRFHRFFYWRALLPGGYHLERIKAVPWQSEVWKKAYPHLSEYITWDPENVQCCPHYCDVSGNVLIDHMPIDINFDWAEESYHNRVENNTIMDALPTGDFRKLCEETIPEMVEGFEAIPFSRIGRKPIEL